MASSVAVETNTHRIQALLSGQARMEALRRVALELAKDLEVLIIP
jgi:hypothetical protein